MPEDLNVPNSHHVVIVGAGFGGLAVVGGLARTGTPVRITVIDQRNHHLFQPLLYQVGTASLATSEIAWPVRHLVRKRKEVVTLLAVVTGIDAGRRQVLLEDGSAVDYDTLIVATGARHAYFGHDEWEPYAPGLKTLEDATSIRRRILLSLERAERETEPGRRAALLTFVIVGGGPTGVELAGAIAELTHQNLPQDFRHIDTRKARVLLIEAGARILPSFTPDLSAYAHAALERLGVEIQLGLPVSDCSGEGVVYGDRRVAADVILWAAGVRASPAATWLNAPADNAGRIKVAPDLSVPGDPCIFVIGDTATVDAWHGKPVPGIAPAAKQQGVHVARTIKRRLAGDSAPRPFRYRHAGNLATVGKRSAVIDFGWIKLRGWLAWWIWGLAHIYFLIGLRNRLAVALSWLWIYTTGNRSACLITQVDHRPKAEPPMQPKFTDSRYLAWLLVPMLAALPNARAADSPPPADRQLAEDMLKTLVEINTTHAHGSTEAAKAIQTWLLTAGFASNDVQFIAPEEHPTKGNLVVRFRGKHPGNAILFMGHLDVVEAKPEDWSVDPFKLTQKEGFFYGRGTIDMKDGDAALAESLIRLKRERFTPERDLIVAFTADEEAGGDSNGPAFLLANHRELIDATMAINLDGGGGNLKHGVPFYFEVGTSEKTYLTYTLQTTSPGGHGSLPGPDNAIYRLADGLGRLEKFKFPVLLTATTRASFSALAALEPGPASADMKAVALSTSNLAPSDLAAAERLSDNARLNAQLHTTCVATLIAGGHAENALPQRAQATVQCRLMPGDTEAHVRELLVSTLDDAAIQVKLDAPPIVSPESPPTAQIMRRITELVHSMWPGVPVIPTMATGFSDDRQTRNAGIPSYDVSGVWEDIDENRAHGRDERVGVQAFDASVEFTYRLMKAMGRAK